MALIYIVEDDVNIREIESFALKNSGYTIEDFACAKDFFARIRDKVPDLVLLDIMLPDEDGLEIVKKLRKKAETRMVPIIMVTAKTSEMDKVKGLDIGADDYLTKPFHNGELLARIRSAIRSIREEKDQSAILSFGDLTIDMLNHCVKMKNEIIKLTSTEFSILSLMAQNAGKVLTHQYLLKEVWGVAYQSQPQYLRVFIAQLRKKIENDPSFPAFILTESGIGYRFSEQTEK